MTEQSTTWKTNSVLVAYYSPILLAVVVLFAIFYFQYRAGRTLAEFSDLWGVHDQMLQPYIQQHHRMPNSWHELSTNNGTEAPWAEYLLEDYQGHLEINFGADAEAEWFIRLKSGRMEGEVDAANERIRVKGC